MSDQRRVFISYARQDGEAFATALRQRIEKEEPEITLWQDRAGMEGGIGWWKQIEDAITRCEFFVIVMTPAAVRSEVTRKEWRYARQHGLCVYPVKGVADSELDYNSLPKWMRKAHFFDLDREWDTFINFDEILKRVSPRLTYTMEDTLGGKNVELAVELCFERMDDFEPANVAARVDPLKPLLEARRQLSNLLIDMDDNDWAQELITRLLHSPDLLHSIVVSHQLADERLTIEGTCRREADDRRI